MKITVVIEIDHSTKQPREVVQDFAHALAVLHNRVKKQPMLIVGDKAELFNNGVHVGSVTVAL